MKKNIFLILVSFLLVLVLVYLYDEREVVMNREYHDDINNISIHYPYFNNIIIDNYLNDYLEPFINQGNDWGDLLFIDYDYEELNNKIKLLMYFYYERGNLVQKEIRRMEVDIENSTILVDDLVMDVNVDYDIYNMRELDKNAPIIALTFDDGPNYNTNRVLDILEKYDVKATFFVLGCNIEGNEKIIKRMSELNMEIGNHMYSHKLLTKLDNKKIESEIKRVDDLIFDITLEYPSLIRPSYGTVNKRLRSIVDRPIVIWNVDTLDWKYHNSKKIFERVIRDVNDGDVILMHDIYRATANSLELIIPYLLEKGYQFVTVSELLYYKKNNISCIYN